MKIPKEIFLSIKLIVFLSSFLLFYFDNGMLIFFVFHLKWIGGKLGFADVVCEEKFIMYFMVADFVLVEVENVWTVLCCVFLFWAIFGNLQMPINLSHRREQGRTFDVEIIILRSDHNEDNQ